jgi:hypothetical protein
MTRRTAAHPDLARPDVTAPAGTHVLTRAEWEGGAPVPRGPGVSRYERALGLVPG